VWTTDKIIALCNLDNGETLSSFLTNQDLQHTVKVPLSAAPLKLALGLHKKMMEVNFIPSILTLISVPLNCHFEYFQAKFGIYPLVVLGDPQSGKTASLRVAAALTGSPSSEQFSDVTDAYATK